LDQYVGEIRLLSFNFAPKGWAFCNGALLAINQNQALFSLLGTYYGGNGIQNFALPDLRSRAPIHMSSANPIGQIGGAEQVALIATQIPGHIHMVQAVNSLGKSQKSINNLLAQSASATGTGAGYAAGTSNLTALNPASIQPAGSGQPHSNIQPYLAMNYCIALTGIFPSRN
jgi:microcystin-dependent protein